MDKYQKETEKILLDHEKEVFKQLKKTYINALAEIKQNIAQLKDDIDELIVADPDNKSLIQSKIYQHDYQKAMEEQLNEILDVVKKDNVNNVQTFLKNMYEDSFLSINYHLQQKGIPVIMPINHKMIIDTINTPTEKLKFSTRLYKHVEDLKKTVKAEISRGIATGSSYKDMARQVSEVARIDLNKAYRIARTEGGRVSSNAKINSMREAKKRGADIVKVWDATLDGNTRYLHRELDQQWAEVDKPFKVRGTEVMHPHGFGIASEDVNCRCSLLSVPRWDLEDKITKLDNLSGELIKTKNYQDWKSNYNQIIKKNYFSGIDEIDIPNFNKEHAKTVIVEATSMLPKHIKEQCKETKFAYYDKNYSKYSPSEDKIYVGKNADMYTVLHEIGHALDEKLDLFSDKNFVKIIEKKFKKYNYNDFELVEKSNMKFFQLKKADDFVEKYQTTLYPIVNNKKAFKINGKVNLENAKEYFTVGLETYYKNPNLLKEKDDNLYYFIKNILEDKK